MTYFYVFLAVLAAIVVAGYLRPWSWTGLRDDSAKPKGKTLWDWLALLIVPAVLAAGAYGINSAQTSREQKSADAREKQQDKIAQDTRHAAALSAYLQQMSGLVADKGLANGEGTDKDDDGFDDSPIAGLAQSLTMTVLRQLDGERRGQVAQFLARAGLIKNDETAVISLYGADLRGAKLFDAFLSNSYFGGADMRGADLRHSWIDGTGFNGADLRDADLSHTEYDPEETRRADFGATCLTGARFTEANLPRATFERAQARTIDFSRATLQSVDFTDAALTNVNTRDARFGKHTPTTFPDGWGTRGLSKKEYDEYGGPCDVLEKRAAP